MAAAAAQQSVAKSADILGKGKNYKDELNCKSQRMLANMQTLLIRRKAKIGYMTQF